MNSILKAKLWRLSLHVSLCCFALPLCSGCASYFKTGEMSYQEREERNKAAKSESEMDLKPGTVIHSNGDPRSYW